jgi:hypothetical protein
MKKLRTSLLLPIVGGIVLIAAGVVLLLNNFNLIRLPWEMLIGLVFGLGGVIFLLVFILNKHEWWAIIPGFVLIAIGTFFFMAQYGDHLANRWGGLVFLGFLGLAFLLVFITHPENWWAIIPAGVLLTLGGISLIQENELLAGGLFFLGLAVTFLLVYVLPKPAGKLKWALYPAGILIVIGIAVVLGAQNLMNYVWPFALLILGGYFVYKAVRSKK